MPCLPIIDRRKSGKCCVGYLCIGNEPVEIQHNGKKYLFEWTAASGWIAVNKDGSERLSRTPNTVWEMLAKVERPTH